MPDLAVQSAVLGVDTPPTVVADETSDLTGLSNTAYAAGAPECSTTFMASTTGRAKVHIYGRLQHDGTNRFWLSYEVHEGTDATGAVFQAANDNKAVSTKDNAQEEGQGTSDLLSGLTPGSPYFVRTMHRVSAGNTGGVRHRRVIVAPAT